MTDSTLHIRQLDAQDWQAFKAIRLHALKTEAGKFGSNFALENGFSDQQWKDKLSTPVAAFFGLFDAGKLVGITGAARQDYNSQSTTAILIASYLYPEYRRQGHSKKFYEARLAWISRQPGIVAVLVSHRKSNEASRRANQAYGFVQTHEEMKLWPDGTSEGDVFYKLDITSRKEAEKTAP